MSATSSQQTLENLQQVIDHCRAHLYHIGFANQTRAFPTFAFPARFVRDDWYYEILSDGEHNRRTDVTITRTKNQYLYSNHVVENYRVCPEAKKVSMNWYRPLTLSPSPSIDGFNIMPTPTTYLTRKVCFYCNTMLYQYIICCCPDHQTNCDKWIADLARVWRIPPELSRQVLEYAFGRGLFGV